VGSILTRRGVQTITSERREGEERVTAQLEEEAEKSEI